MLAPVLVTPPAAFFIDVDDAKAHLRVDHADEDDLIQALVDTAVARLDGWTGILGRALVTQTWRHDFENFDCLQLLVGPVASITNVKHYDSANTLQTLSTDVYQLAQFAGGPEVVLKPDQVWPAYYSRIDAVQVTFVAGVAAASVPAPIKAAALLIVGDLYENRESVLAGGGASKIPMSTTIEALIAPYRRRAG